MQNARLDKTQARIKIAGRNIKNLRCVDGTTLMAESKEEPKSLWMKVKEESEKVGLTSTFRILRSWRLVPSLMANRWGNSGWLYFGGLRNHFEESWAPKNWCFWTVVLEKTLESPLDCKEIQPIHPKEDQSCVFTGRTDVEAETPILWPPDVKSWFTWKDPDIRKDWWQEEKWTTDEMVGWHHQLNGHEFE